MLYKMRQTVWWNTRFLQVYGHRSRPTTLDEQLYDRVGWCLLHNALEHHSYLFHENSVTWLSLSWVTTIEQQYNNHT